MEVHVVVTKWVSTRFTDPNEFEQVLEMLKSSGRMPTEPFAIRKMVGRLNHKSFVNFQTEEIPSLNPEWEILLPHENDGLPTIIVERDGKQIFENGHEP